MVRRGGPLDEKGGSADAVRVSVLPLSDVSPEHVAAVEAIYRTSFPPSEQIPFESLVHPPSGESRTVSVMCDPTRVYGFASVYMLRSFPADFLEFLAIDRRLRGGGFGSTLFQHVRRMAAARPGITGLIFEVDDPEEDGIEASEVDVRLRRIRFYRNNGADLLPVEGYRVPSRVDDESFPLRLVWVPTEPTYRLPAARIPDVIDALRAESYGLPPHDRRTISISAVSDAASS